VGVCDCVDVLAHVDLLVHPAVCVPRLAGSAILLNLVCTKFKFSMPIDLPTDTPSVAQLCCSGERRLLHMFRLSCVLRRAPQ
jgi:hypothetical protein